MLTAEEILNQRYDQVKTASQSQFEQEWDATSDRFGPRTGNTPVEKARKDALDRLHAEWIGHANTLTQKYQEKLQSFKEIDGLVPDKTKAAEVKLRSILGPDAEKALFPQSKDPIREAEEVGSFVGKVEGQLRHFNLPAPVAGSRWLNKEPRGTQPLTVGGGRELDESTGETITVPSRPASDEETEEFWKLRRTRNTSKSYYQRLLSSNPMASRIGAAVVGSARGYDTPVQRTGFEEQVKQSKVAPTPVSPAPVKEDPEERVPMWDDTNRKVLVKRKQVQDAIDQGWRHR